MQTVRILLRIGFPIVGIVPDVPERAFRHRRIGAFADLPAVVDLKMRDAEACGPPDLLQTKAFVDLRILTAVAPRVHHHHLVAPRELFPQLFLIAPQSGQLLQLPARPDTDDASVGPHPLPAVEVPLRKTEPRNREIPEFGREIVTLIGRLHVRTGSLFQEKEAAVVLPAAGEQQIAPVVVLPVRDHVGLEDQIVVPVRNVLKLDDPRLPMEPAGIEPVEHARTPERTHILFRLDVLPVAEVRGTVAGKRSGGASFQVGVAGNGRSIPVNPVDPPDGKRAQRKFHGRFQVFRMDSGLADPGRRIRSGRGFGIAGNLEIGRRSAVQPHLPRRLVGQAVRHEVSAVPDEFPLDPGVADRQGVVSQTAVTIVLCKCTGAAQQRRGKYRECVFHRF